MSGSGDEQHKVNPARELAELLKGGSSTWEARSREVTLVRALEEQLEIAELKAENTDFLNELQQLILDPPAHRRISNPTFYALSLLARILDDLPTTPAIADADIQQMSDAIDECISIIDRQPRSAQDRLGYLRYLLTCCRECLDPGSVNLIELKRMSVEVIGVATLVLDGIPEEEKTSFVAAAKEIVGPWAFAISSGSVAGTVGTVAGGAIQLALGGGL